MAVSCFVESPAGGELSTGIKSFIDDFILFLIMNYGHETDGTDDRKFSLKYIGEGNNPCVVQGEPSCAYTCSYGLYVNNVYQADYYQVSGGNCAEPCIGDIQCHECAGLGDTFQSCYINCPIWEEVELKKLLPVEADAEPSDCYVDIRPTSCGIGILENSTFEGYPEISDPYIQEQPPADIKCMLDAFKDAPDTGSLDSEFVDCLRIIQEALCCSPFPCYLLIGVCNYWRLEIEENIIPVVYFSLQMYFPHFLKPHQGGMVLDDYCYKRDFVFEDVITPLEDDLTDFISVITDFVKNFNLVQNAKLKALIEMQGINIQEQNLQQENSEHFDIDVEIIPEDKSKARYSFAIDIIKKAISILSGTF